MSKKREIIQQHAEHQRELFSLVLSSGAQEDVKIIGHKVVHNRDLRILRNMIFY
jgi:hypothetical protein